MSSFSPFPSLLLIVGVGWVSSSYYTHDAMWFCARISPFAVASRRRIRTRHLAEVVVAFACGGVTWKSHVLVECVVVGGSVCVCEWIETSLLVVWSDFIVLRFGSFLRSVVLSFLMLSLSRFYGSRQHTAVVGGLAKPDVHKCVNHVGKHTQRSWWWWRRRCCGRFVERKFVDCDYTKTSGTRRGRFVVTGWGSAGRRKEEANFMRF